MDVEDDTGIAIDERCRLDIVKVVVDVENVVMAGLMAFEAGCVDRLNLAESCSETDNRTNTRQIRMLRSCFRVQTVVKPGI